MTDPIHSKQQEAKQQEVVNWAPDGSPVSIQYPLELMAQIRDHVIVGFHRLARRGIECGGILYGTREARHIQVQQIREIRCEYKLGPSFLLSDSDRERVAQQLREPDSDLAGLAPVGLYVSHTKDDIRATERDLAVYNEFFPDPWQVLLILRPARQGSVRAGFFVREPFGGMRTEQSYEEFELEPPESAAEVAALMAQARQPLEPLSPDGGPPPAGLSTPYSAPADDPGRPNFSGAPFATGRGGAAAAPALARQRDFEEPVPDPGRALVYADGGRYGRQLAPADQVQGAIDQLHQRNRGAAYQQMPWPNAGAVPKQKHWLWLGAWILGIVALAGVTYTVLNMRNPAPLLLRIAEQNGDLRIEWDRASSTIHRAAGGVLEIRDGKSTRDLHLTAEQLANGSYLFPVTQGDVSVRLAVTGMFIPRVEESVNFVGEAKPAESDASRLTQENRTLRNDLRRERENTERLEQRLRALEERVSGTPARKTRRKPAPTASSND